MQFKGKRGETRRCAAAGTGVRLRIIKFKGKRVETPPPRSAANGTPVLLLWVYAKVYPQGVSAGTGACMCAPGALNSPAAGSAGSVMIIYYYDERLSLVDSARVFQHAVSLWRAL